MPARACGWKRFLDFLRLVRKDSLSEGTLLHHLSMKSTNVSFIPDWSSLGLTRPVLPLRTPERWLLFDLPLCQQEQPLRELNVNLSFPSRYFIKRYFGKTFAHGRSYMCRNESCFMAMSSKSKMKLHEILEWDSTIVSSWDVRDPSFREQIWKPIDLFTRMWNHSSALDVGRVILRNNLWITIW